MNFLDRLERYFVRFEWRIVTGLVALLALRLWISPLSSSLWVDETATWWASGGSFTDWVNAMKTTQFPQSPLYTLFMWMVAQVTGFHEVLLRLPSVAAMTAAAAMLYRVGRTLFGPMPGIYSLLLWISLGNVSFAAADARPYGIALFAVICSAYSFIRWLQTGKLYLVIGNGVALTVAIHCNYYFGAILLAQVTFVLFAHLQGWLRLRPVMLFSPLLTGIMLLPVLAIVPHVAREAGIHVVSGMPSWTDLGMTWMPPRWIVAAALATGAIAMIRPAKISFAATMLEPSAPLSRMATLYWLALLAVTPPLLLFLFSHLGKTPAFLPRYYLSMTPGLSLLGAYAVSCLQPSLWRWAFALTLFGMSMLPGGARLWTSHHQTEDWRTASAIVRAIREKDPTTMVLAGTSFTESRFLPAPVDAVQKRWLLTPQIAYPVPGPLELLPIEVTPSNESDFRSVINRAAERDHFVVWVPATSPTAPWIMGRFSEQYQSTVLHPEPLVVRFDRRAGK